MPRSRVWWVSSSRSTTSAGSSSTSRCRALASLSSSVWVRATTATASTGSAGATAGTRTGVPLGASVSPVAVPDSLATAAMSPATAAAEVEVLAAAQGEQPVEPLVGPGAGVDQVVVGCASCPTGPSAARSGPTWRSAMVLNTQASGWPSGSGRDLHRGAVPASTSTGGRSSGDGPISQMKSARRSMPTRAVAEPHTTGNTEAASSPWASVCSSCSSEGVSPVEEPLEQVVVGHHDALHQVVVHLVLERLHVVGDLARVARRGAGRSVRVQVVGEGGVGQQVGHAAERGLLADRELRAGRRRRRRRSRISSRVRSNDARSRSSLLMKTMRGRPSSAADPPQRARSAPRPRRPR